MIRTFVDTSAWLALRDRKARAHEAVRSWFESSRTRLVTTSDVVDEAVTLASSRWGHAVAVDLGRRMMDPQEVHFVFVEEALYEAGWARFQDRQDKRYSLTDCTSFVVMERLGVEEAVSLDRHFAQEGFRVVP